MVSKRNAEIQLLLADGVDVGTIAKAFNLSRQRVSQIKRKLLRPTIRIEQRTANDIEEIMSVTSATVAAGHGGYLYHHTGPGYQKKVK